MSTPTAESTFATKENWEVELDIDMNELFAPITMESLIEQLEQQEMQRLSKYLDEQQQNRKNRKDDQQGQSSSGRASAARWAVWVAWADPAAWAVRWEDSATRSKCVR